MERADLSVHSSATRAPAARHAAAAFSWHCYSSPSPSPQLSSCHAYTIQVSGRLACASACTAKPCCSNSRCTAASRPPTSCTCAGQRRRQRDQRNAIADPRLQARCQDSRRSASATTCSSGRTASGEPARQGAPPPPLDALRPRRAGPGHAAPPARCPRHQSVPGRGAEAGERGGGTQQPA